MKPFEGLVIDLPAISRGGHQVLEPVAFSLPTGSWCGLIGVNGVGKSSLILSIAGRLETVAPAVSLFGQRLDTPSLRARHLGLAVVPERLPPEIKLGVLIRLVAKAQGVNPYSDKLAPLYHALALSNLEHQFIDRLSAGQKQRLGLYLAFIGEPPVVLLDEPFNALDPLISFNLKQALKTLCDQGLILVTALHDMSLMALNCSHGLMLVQGRLARVFTPQDMAKARVDPAGFERDVLGQWQNGNSRR